jgi:arylformamidase
MNDALNPERATGPLVWLDMDQKALDDAYDQRVYATNREQVMQRNRFNSARARAILGEPKRISYGDTSFEKLEVFSTRHVNAPIHIFIHGGAWRQRDVKDDAYRAAMVVAGGAHWVGVDFAGVENTGGDLLQMAEQVTRAVVWVFKNAATFGGDANRIYLSGWSSGAHLGGCLVTTDWRSHGLPQDVIKGAVLCSGMYELEPVRLSKRSEYVSFSDEVVAKLSSQRHLDRLVCPLVIAYGSYETPEFKRQSVEFAAAVKAAGKPVDLLVAEGYNHFEVGELAGNPFGLLGAAILKQMEQRE